MVFPVFSRSRRRLIRLAMAAGSPNAGNVERSPVASILLHIHLICVSIGKEYFTTHHTDFSEPYPFSSSSTRVGNLNNPEYC